MLISISAKFNWQPKLLSMLEILKAFSVFANAIPPGL